LIEDDTSILQSTSESCDCPRNIASLCPKYMVSIKTCEASYLSDDLYIMVCFIFCSQICL